MVCEDGLVQLRRFLVAPREVDGRGVAEPRIEIVRIVGEDVSVAVLGFDVVGYFPLVDMYLD